MMSQGHEHHITTEDRTTLSNSERRRIYQKLHLAALEGNWKKAKKYYSKYEPEISCNAKITKRDETVHIAVVSDKVEFVKHVVRMMCDADLDLRDDAGNTAFFLAVTAGKVDCFEVMMKRKPNLAIARGVNDELPLFVAASRGYSKMVWRLYDAAKSYMEYNDKINIFIALIRSNFCDVALDMIQKDNTVALAENANNVTALLVLAQNPSFIRQNFTAKTWQHFIWQDSQVFVRRMGLLEFSFPGLISMLIKGRSMMHKKAFELMNFIWDRVMQLDDLEIIPKFSPLMFVASQKGNTEFLTLLFHYYPNLMASFDDNGYTIYHKAIMHRQEDIFRLINDVNPVTQKISTHRDRDGNSMLHLAAKLPSIESGLHMLPGAALQLQRELLWFEEVKKVVPILTPCLEATNNEGLTPEDVFMKSHEKMLEDEEKWMKGTASKSIVVATLIATMVFQAVLDVPSQSKDQEFGLGFAYFLFFVAVAVALVSSVASVMVFLGIITARYHYGDFHRSIPRKLMIGLLTLFISLLAMLVAFGFATFTAFYDAYSLQGCGYVLIAIGTTPLFFFIWMHSRLFTNIYYVRNFSR